MVETGMIIGNPVNVQMDIEQQHKVVGQMYRILEFLQQQIGKWFTVQEICDQLDLKSITGTSANIRNLRKAEFGEYPVASRERQAGLWEYSLLASNPIVQKPKIPELKNQIEIVRKYGQISIGNFCILRQYSF
jgi:hypothetical protein